MSDRYARQRNGAVAIGVDAVHRDIRHGAQPGGAAVSPTMLGRLRRPRRRLVPEQASGSGVRCPGHDVGVCRAPRWNLRLHRLGPLALRVSPGRTGAADANGSHGRHVRDRHGCVHVPCQACRQPPTGTSARWCSSGWSWFAALRSWPSPGDTGEEPRARLRLERDLSQGALAEALGVSRQTINAIETGKYDPSLPLAFTIAAHFRLRIEDIFRPDKD